MLPAAKEVHCSSSNCSRQTSHCGSRETYLGFGNTPSIVFIHNEGRNLTTASTCDITAFPMEELTLME